ncbi:MAG: flippase-like domain-containing protein [Parcubacteria group bacterium]|nr:flippase-like domain-containing protein [Parcubacteria group bacterium]
MKRFLLFFVGAFGVALAVWILRRVGVQEIVGALRGLAAWEIAAIFLFPFLAFLLAAARLKLILGSFSVYQSLWRLWRLVFAGAAMSLLIPSYDVVGQTTRALILKRKGIEGPVVFSVLALDFVARAVTNVVFSLLLLSLVIRVGYLFMVPLLCVAVFLLWKAMSRGGTFTKFLRRFVPAHSHHDLVEFDTLLAVFAREKHAIMLRVVLITALGYLWEIAQVGIALYFLGGSLNIFQTVTMYLAVSLPRVVPVPGGFGFVEIGGVVSSGLLGISGSLGLTMVLVLRVRDITTLVVGLAMLWKERDRV